jgi:hypothetical protein
MALLLTRYSIFSGVMAVVLFVLAPAAIRPVAAGDNRPVVTLGPTGSSADLLSDIELQCHQGKEDLDQLAAPAAGWLRYF